MRPNPALHPPMGYVFYDKSERREFVGADWQDLAQKIENYRRANKLPVGNPLEECYNQFCQEHPTHCSASKKQTVVLSRHTLGARVAAWIGNLFVGKVPAATDKHTAGSRAAICAKCPLQTEWRAHCGCSVQALQEVKKHWFRMRNIRPKGNTENLKACLSLGEECSMSVWMNQPAKDLGQPKNCWRLQSD